MQRIPWSAGQARFWRQVYVPTPGYGPVHLALGRPQGSPEDWVVVSAAPTEAKPFEAYGVRVDIDANGCDDQSQGVQLESSLLRAANAFERRGGVLALATRSLVAQGTAVVTHGTRRWVDAQWFRGQRSLNIGWHGGTLALSRGYELLTRVQLSADPDPLPAMASKIPPQKPSQRFLTLEFQDAVA